MNEYNWKKEKNCVRCENSAPVSGASFQTRPVEKSQRKKVLLFSLAAVIVITGILFLISIPEKEKENAPAPQKTEKSVLSVDSAKALADVAEKNRHAIALVGISLPEANFFTPLGTAWAIKETEFVTNGHVVNGLKETVKMIGAQFQRNMLTAEFKKAGVKSEKEYIQKFGSTKLFTEKKRIADEIQKLCEKLTVELRVNGMTGKGLPATHVQIHPEYVKTNDKSDLGIIHTSVKHNTFFSIASEKTLLELKSGDPIGYLGFPMENIPGDNVDIQNPIASMQTGIIVAVSDFDLKNRGSRNNFLIRHNLPSSGGASGSPLFNSKGVVIAVHNASSKIPGTRFSSGSLINYGVRVDKLSGMGPKISLKEFLKQK